MSDDMRTRTLIAESDRLRHGGSSGDPEVRDAAFRRYGVVLGASGDAGSPSFGAAPNTVAGAGGDSWIGGLIAPVAVILLGAAAYGGWLAYSYLNAPAPTKALICSGQDPRPCKSVGEVYAIVHSEMMEIGSVLSWFSGDVPYWMASIDDANARASGDVWRAWRKAVVEAREKMLATEPKTPDQQLAILRPLQAAYAKLNKG